MKLLMKKMCLVYLICSFIFCGCSYCDEKKEKELVLQLESADAEKTENATDEALIKETDLEFFNTEVYVYVCGAVKNEGVYVLDENSRVFEAIEMAGGFTEDADRSNLNLARVVTDGEQITILTKEEAQAEVKLQAMEKSGVVNINTATVSELTSISGIGESRAKAIIDYREKNGNFKTIDDIKKIDGIKEGLFSKIKDKIKV